MIPTRLLRRPRVLIVGCGDVGLRTVVPASDNSPHRAAAPAALTAASVFSLATRCRVLALSRNVDRDERLRAVGITPVRGDLDELRSLRRTGSLARSAWGILHFAPPRSTEPHDYGDGRMRHFLASMQASNSATSGKRRRLAPRLVYASTTGVYGDCGGALIDETKPVQPANARAKRRVDAEWQLRRAGRRGTIVPSILRIPGIYAGTRLPEARLRRGTPALRLEDDVFTSHIHADDLAAIAVCALWRGRSQRLYHAVDDSRLRMGVYFTLVADALALPHPPTISRDEAERTIEPTLLSFMRESRQLRNDRLKHELRYALRYPTVQHFLATLER